MESKTKKRILIVEDSVDTQFLLAEFLRSEGYLVDCANNGGEALALLRGAIDLPGLILLDVMMPEMDGNRFRQEQVNDKIIAHIPVVIMTAGGSSEADALRSGASGFLRKPFPGLESILQTVERFFEKD